MVGRLLTRFLIDSWLLKPLPRPFNYDSGLCWTAKLPELAHLSDGCGWTSRSTLGLYEDGVPLQPPHSDHVLIRAEGGGAFSHWDNQVYFSTTDGSDPNTNGRSYRYTTARWLYRRRTHALPLAHPPTNHRTREATPEKIQADIRYVLDTTGACLHRMLAVSASLAGKTVLEVGPGPNFAAVLALAALGARPAVADRFLAPWQEEYHPKFYAALADEVARRYPTADVRCLRAVVEANGYPEEIIRRYECAVEDLAVPSDSMDFVFSNAVGEHLFDVGRAFEQIYRATRPGGYGMHQIDFRDHNRFDRPLEFLLMNEKDFQAEFQHYHGERGNRLRPDEVAGLMRAAGFEILDFEPNILCTPEYLEDFLPRLRRTRTHYRHWSAESLRTVSGFFRLRKPARR
jgi:SAM-dependent methyltransferase